MVINSLRDEVALRSISSIKLRQTCLNEGFVIIRITL